ncbi:MAG: hypothetical protein ACKVUS_22335 [Saprospiraceae bacterium]
MKNTFSKLIGFLLLSFLSWQTATAQYKSNRVDTLISEYDYLRDSDSIGVGLPLNLSQTLPNYYRSAYLYLHDELQDQLDQLIEIGPLPKSPLGDPSGRQILEEHIAAEGRMAAKMKEIDLVSKAANISGEPLSSPQLLLSDWQLRSYHHQLLRAFALNEGFPEQDMVPFKIVYEDVLGAVEKELRERGMFPKSPKAIPDFQILSEQRFALVEEMQQSAKKEALLFADNSPLFLEEREHLFDLAEQIGEIDGKMGIKPDNLPRARDLLTEETVVFRLNVLDHGKKTLEEKCAATRDFADENLLRLSVIDEQVASERRWLYAQKNHQAIDRGYTSRGPPGESGALGFEEPPFPKMPSPGDLTLDRFLDEAKAASIGQEKQAAFEKVVSRQLERCKAHNLQVPQWQSHARTSKLSRTTSIKTPESFLRFLATRRLETLSADHVASESYKVEFDCANQRLYEDEGRTMPSFLEDDPAKLAEIETNLKGAHEKTEKRVAALGDLASPGLRHEAEELKTALDEVHAARQNMVPKPRIVDGNWPPRPPPAETDFPEGIRNEAYRRAVLIEQKRNLERAKARYGMDAPPSLDFRLNEINKILITNDMATSLGEYQKYANDASEVKILERLSEFIPEFLPDVKELKAKQAALFANFDDSFERLGTLPESSVPPKVFEAAGNARKALVGGRKGAKVEGSAIWRSTQDLEAVKSMELAKTPGGIWLSPEGFEIQPVVPLDLPWSSVAFDDYCPNEDDMEWIIDPEAEYVEKICFPRTEKPVTTQHWLNQIKSW